jgi:hypothetical protein
MSVTMSEVKRALMAQERVHMERTEVEVDKLRCAEYVFHPENKYLLCFESSLTPSQIQALRSMFSGKEAKNVFVICGTEEPKVFILSDPAPVQFPEKRKFLED